MQIHLLFLALFAAITHAAILPFTQIPLTEPPTQLDICPELEVTCVLDGDWRHPVGKLGKKRESSSMISRIKLTVKLSVGKVSDAINVMRKEIRGNVIGDLRSVGGLVRLMDRFPFD